MRTLRWRRLLALGGWLACGAGLLASPPPLPDEGGGAARTTAAVRRVSQPPAPPEPVPQPPLAPGQPQPPAEQPPEAAGPRMPPQEQALDRRRLLASRSRYQLPARTRMARVPNMFGDAIGVTDQLVLFRGAFTPNGITVADVPLVEGRGARASKIAENNRALPTDRVYFTYHHYSNVYSSRAFAPGGMVLDGTASLDRYTLGCEKTFDDAWCSLELRLPLSDTNGPGYVGLPSDGQSLVTGSGGGVGNLTAIAKRLLLLDCNLAVAGGVGVEVPTGLDGVVRVADTTYRLSNQAVHVLPFAAVMGSPLDNWFWNGFVQMDVPTHGNELEVRGQGSRFSFGDHRPRTLLYADLGLGRWLYRNDCPRCGVAGLAAFVEGHYTTALNDNDVTSGVVLGQTFRVSRLRNHLDIVNLSFGAHVQTASNMTLRVGGVVPLSRDDAKRLFDSEVAAQLNWRF